MCDDCTYRARHPENYARQGYTLCRDFEMPVVTEPPSEPATPVRKEAR